MNFPSFADTSAFVDLGARCADALVSPTGGIWEKCYNPVRPVGIIAYYAIPHLLTDDPVVMNYLILSMNLLLGVLILMVMGRVMALDPGFQPLKDSRFSGAAKAVLFLCVLFSFLGHLPITLADLPANGLFLSALGVGCWVLFAPNGETHSFRYFLLGLFAAGSTLMKQNFFVFGGFLALVVMYFDNRNPSFNRLAKKTLMFLLGFSLVLVQFLYVYSHSGDFFLFERKVVHLLSKPYVELVAYNRPIQSAYLVRVTEEVNDLTFFVLKVYSGIFRFEIPVYLGNLSHSHPPDWTPSPQKYVKMYLLVGMLFLWLFFGSLYGPKSLRIACIIAISYITFTGLWEHTEYRYYLFPRLVFWISCAYWFFMSLIRSARNLRQMLLPSSLDP